MSENIETALKKYHCPRCKISVVLDFGDIIECSKCGLSFTKSILDAIEHGEILSDNEIVEILKIFQNDGDLDRLKE